MKIAIELIGFRRKVSLLGLLPGFLDSIWSTDTCCPGSNLSLAMGRPSFMPDLRVCFPCMHAIPFGISHDFMDLDKPFSLWIWVNFFPACK